MGGDIHLIDSGSEDAAPTPDVQLTDLSAIDARPDAERRAAMEARGWAPAKPRERRVSPALEAYAAMTTSAARGAIRDVSQIKRG